HPKTYFSLRLSSCPTSTILFQYVSLICEKPVQQLSVLRMHFDFESGDDEEEGKGKGVMGVKKGVEESFVCFVQEVERREKEQGKGKGGNGVGVGVGVEVVLGDGGEQLGQGAG
ncbi:MAG: hypothetical protein Q9169_008341, partial [Polycauliona sp. 2 TL-2023]